ncbi:phenylalanine--tRNA ligase subunit beta [Salipaludibacillus keqinensis]|uniref:Phenylalanine--tRNA ligase beta subunit n=1 Tax=Salipaludibacillus keqinensis TaxID=2045207 RepID=A0A323TM36_9BACI|nr:phenylalanine--tRNA ligase subunit beta [Salipaludibacillus keqinensis]PYZ93703.1 phenylalanine--tRNA ligase subunit beta [Salipaludibacillus keqinensis]
MLVSYKWLKEYIDIDEYSAKEVAEKLTRSGVEVDAIHPLNKEITNLVVGKVVECVKHPEADKLNICQVDVGEIKPVQIVCGAKNVGEGQYVAVARVGARLSGGMKIKRAKLRGEVSEGMICSLQELGFEGKLVPKKYSEGIFNFPQEMLAGEDALSPLGLDDTILELDLTPNRSDCLSMLGVAYEVAAILGVDVKVPEPAIVASKEKASDFVKVHVEASGDNPYYGATVIKGVKIGESPLWLQTALIASGVRPINNVVDVTNYVLLEYGQPLHAFDLDTFGSKEVLVRRATEGEKIVTLDESERTLSGEHLVITNGEDPVALAGVMGGATSEVNDDTVNLLLEAAYFDPGPVRKASRDLGLRSDSSVRFEKGVDPNRVAAAGLRAASLIQQLAGGEILEGPVEFDQLNREPREVSITLDKVNNTLGTQLEVEQIERIFDQLQFPFKENNALFTVDVPTRRQDISIEADLVEEIARLYGYDHIPTTLPNTPTTPGGLTTTQLKKRKTRRFLEGAGMHEAISYSLTTAEKEAHFTENVQSRVKVALPMSEERSTLRTTLLPHLLDALSYNKNRNSYHVHLYEMGSVFHTEENQVTVQPEEKTYVSGAFMGLWHEHSWQGEKKPVDFYVVKGIVEGLLSELDVNGEIRYVQYEKAGLHPGRTALLEIDGKEVGFLGQLHPSTAKEWSLPATYVFELNLQSLMEGTEENLRYEAIPKYPAMDRDIALVVDESVKAEDLQRIILNHGGKLLTRVAVFDLYQGENLAPGKKSLAFSLRYLDRDKTLTEEEVSAVHEKVLLALEENAGAILRS